MSAVTIVTGAAGDIGAACARVLAARGVPVLLTDREIADVIAFPLSPAASYVTGAVLLVDGGLTVSP